MRNKSLAVMAGISAVGLLLAGCSLGGDPDPFAGKGSPKYTKSGPVPKGGGRYHVGNTYQVAGRSFTPREDPGYDRRGLASWYGPKFHRRMTANGEWFDMGYRSAAHPTLPLPSYAKVTNLENGRQMIVRINDRGPFVGDRIIDLSRRSAEILDFKQQGKAEVRVEYLGRAPLNDKGSHLAAMNEALERGVPKRQLIAAADGGSPAIRLANNQKQPVLALSASHSQPVAQAGYFIQAGAYSDRNNADRAQARLQPVGPVQVTQVNAGFGTVYRVRLGPWNSAEAADEALWQVHSAGHHDAKVVAVN